MRRDISAPAYKSGRRKPQVFSIKSRGWRPAGTAPEYRLDQL